MTVLVEWLQANETALWWLGGFSVLVFVVTLIAVPLLVVRIPADYFEYPGRRRHTVIPRHSVWGILILVFKNILGLLLLLAGVAMLALPGQGIITILVALTLLNFPGKYRLERWMISRGPVLRAVNWFRQRHGCATFDPDQWEGWSGS